MQSKYNDVFEEVQSKYNDEHSSNFYAARNQFTQNKIVSKTSVKTLSNNQEDQVLFRSKLY